MNNNPNYIKEYINNLFYKKRYEDFFAYSNIKDKDLFINTSSNFVDLNLFNFLDKIESYNFNHILKKLNLTYSSSIIFYLNGYYYSSLNIPEEISLVNFKNFNSSILNYLKLFPDIKNENVFINNIFYNEGCFVYLPFNLKIKDPIYIINIFDSFFTNSIVHPNNIYVLDEGASLNLMEYYINLPINLSLNIKSLVLLKKSAHLNFCFLNKVNSVKNSCFYFSSILDSNSVLNSEFHNFSNNFFDSKLNFNLFGENSNLDLRMSKISRLNFSEKIKVNLRHFASSSKSNTNFKGLVNDSSNVSFKGLIEVEKFAYKTDAALKCDGLLLSNKASIDLYPELDIENNDIKCSHGATVGSISDILLYYMASRGFSKNDSISLIVKAFLIPTMNVEGCFFNIVNKILLEEF